MSRTWASLDRLGWKPWAAFDLLGSPGAAFDLLRRLFCLLRTVYLL